MDFEEQLEKAEKLPTPSLVGSSIRSADDSPHNNYIHPEKSKKKQKEKTQKHSILNQSISASLDDLMREGALLGSEEDFEELLDDGGNVKDDARYVGGDDEQKQSPLRGVIAAGDAIDELDGGAEATEKSEEPAKTQKKATEPASVKAEGSKKPGDGKTEPASKDDKPAGSLLYNQENYSTPNLSEYQLDHQIRDHKDLLTNIKSHDPQRLPSSQSDYANEGDSYFKRPVSPSKRSQARPTGVLDDDVTIAAGATEGLHTPYFQRDSRSKSRSGPSYPDRSRSRSAVAPHLARGDSYKNTNVNDPSNYELPPDLQSEIKDEDEEDETQDRRSRQSKPTMGESIAAAEASNERFASLYKSAAAMKRDPSLVTTGDYTNFDVDRPEPRVEDSSNLYSMRSASSTNYLRSISRSRSRQPENDIRASNLYSEKNDADPEELARTGALITDDPYATIGGLDTMVEEVLNPVSESSEVNARKASKSSDKKDSNSTVPSDVGAAEHSKGSKEVGNDSSITRSSLPSSDSKSKNSNNALDDKAIEQIESSLESEDPKSNDPILDKAEKLTSKDISGKSTDANTKLADSYITEDKKIDKSVRSVDDAAIDQIEASVDTNDQILEKAESLTSKDIHPKTVTSSIEDAKSSEDNTVDTTEKSESLSAKDIQGEATTNTKGTDSYIPDDKEAGKEKEKTLDETAVEKIESEKAPVTEKAKVLSADDIVTKGQNDDSEETSNVDNVKSTEGVTGSEKSTATTEDNDKLSKSSEIAESQSETGDIIAKDTNITKNEKLESLDSKTSEKIDKVETSSTASKGDTDSSAVPVKDKVDSKDDDSVVAAAATVAAGKSDDLKSAESKDIDKKEVDSKNDETKSSGIASAAGAAIAAATAAVATTAAAVTSSDDKKHDTQVSKEDTEKADAKEQKTDLELKDIDVTSAAVSAANVATSTDSEPKDQKQTDTAAKTAATAATVATDKAAAAEDDLGDINVSPEELRKHLESQPVYIFTSLAGGMPIMTRTNRLTTILNANSVKFEYRDLGTDEEAKKIWRRQANGKTLPGVVRGDDYIGNWQEIDEANEEYRVRELLYETL